MGGNGQGIVGKDMKSCRMKADSGWVLLSCKCMGHGEMEGGARRPVVDWS
jgi:hypothetical protein